MTTESPILELLDVRIVFRSFGSEFVAVHGASLKVMPGESVGIVGESGSGKSSLARSVVGLLSDGVAPIEGGRILVSGVPVPKDDLWRLRGKTVAMVFQDPLSYLNPVMSVGRQIAEGVKRHDKTADVRKRVVELLDLVKLPATARQSYPHELSGGMRQRVLLAIALGCRPQLLIADEPTTALDVTTQGEILALIKSIRSQLNMALVLISHDLSVISSLCDRVYVMYRGRIVESGTVDSVFRTPSDPYTISLLNANMGLRDENNRFVTRPREIDGIAAVDQEGSEA